MIGRTVESNRVRGFLHQRCHTSRALSRNLLTESRKGARVEAGC